MGEREVHTYWRRGNLRLGRESVWHRKWLPLTRFSLQEAPSIMQPAREHTASVSRLCLSNHPQFKSQEQSHSSAFFGWVVCIYLSFSDKKQKTQDRKKKHTLTHHLQGHCLAWGHEEKRVSRVPTSERNRDELPQPFVPSHFHSSFPFILFTSSLSAHWATRTNGPGGQSFLDDCWIAFEPMLPQHIFFKAEFLSSENLVL